MCFKATINSPISGRCGREAPWARSAVEDIISSLQIFGEETHKNGERAAPAPADIWVWLPADKLPACHLTVMSLSV